MALLNNLGSLVEMFMMSEESEENRQLADRAGVETNDFSKIAALGLPLLLQGMNKNNQSKKGLESFNQALQQHQTRNDYNSIGQFAQNIDTTDGDKIVNHVLSDNKSSVSSSLADRLGVSPEAVQRTLAILAPLVLKHLADRQREKNLDATDVQQETQNLTQEVAMQVRDRHKPTEGNKGLLGDLFNSFTDSHSNQANKEKDSGLLGDLFNLFK